MEIFLGGVGRDTHCNIEKPQLATQRLCIGTVASNLLLVGWKLNNPHIPIQIRKFSLGQCI